MLNEGNNASAMPAKTPTQCWQPRGCDEDNNANTTMVSMGVEVRLDDVGDPRDISGDQRQ